jgi:hypothetical protein
MHSFFGFDNTTIMEGMPSPGRSKPFQHPLVHFIRDSLHKHTGRCTSDCAARG